MKTALWSGLFFGVWMAFVFGMMFGWQMALVSGLSAGLFFGLSMAGFIALMSKRMSGKLPLLPGEEVIKEGPANHFYNGEGVGGWLTVTNQRLHFTSHKINFQVHDVSLPLYQIAGAETAATLGILPTGLKIRLADGQTEKFVVNGRAEWVDALARVKGLRV